jgi:hypothetical protein
MIFFSTGCRHQASSSRRQLRAIDEARLKAVVLHR